MAKIPANPIALKRAWRETVQGSTLPRKAQADAAGVAYSTWCAWADDEQPDALPTFRRLPGALSHAVDHPAFVDYLASLQGRITVPLPEAAPCDTTQLADLCARFGRAVEHAAQAMASGGWDVDEAHEYEALGRELVRAVLSHTLAARRRAVPVPVGPRPRRTA